MKVRIPSPLRDMRKSIPGHHLRWQRRAHPFVTLPWTLTRQSTSLKYMTWTPAKNPSWRTFGIHVSHATRSRNTVWFLTRHVFSCRAPGFLAEHQDFRRASAVSNLCLGTGGVYARPKALLQSKFGPVLTVVEGWKGNGASGSCFSSQISQCGWFWRVFGLNH